MTAASRLRSLLGNRRRAAQPPTLNVVSDPAQQARDAIGAADWERAKSIIAGDAALAFHLGSDFLPTDPARGLFCRKLAADLAPHRLLYTLPQPWIELECESAAAGKPLPSALGERLAPLPGGGRVPGTMVDPELLGAHIEILRTIDRINLREGNFSATTPRFRTELVYYLLDNRARGPIVEIGIAKGGFSCQFLYIAALTGRTYLAIDIDPGMTTHAKATTARFGLAGHGRMFLGSLQQYIEQHGWFEERCDLVFLDSSHHYSHTLEELRLLHANRPLPHAIALHDFNYRMGKYDMRDDPEKTDPIAVDHACYRFLSDHLPADLAMPTLKRIGAFTGDGAQATPRNPGAVMGDFVDFYGGEGMMILHP